jgi:glyoxylase-like metal-dependent hydrolase (beta-lactamase superfamily II)
MEKTFKNLSDEFKEIILVEGQQGARYPYSNSLIIDKVLIDTGAGSKTIRTIKRKFDIKTIFLSHWHEDHISGNRYFKDADIQFFAHKMDKPIIEDVHKMIEAYGVNGTPVESELNELLKLLRMKNVRVNQIIKDGQIIDISEDHRIRVIHTPGHTAGHCSFYDIASKLIFLGDIDLSSFPFYGSVDASLIDLEASIDNLKGLDMQLAYSGHKGIIEGKKEIKTRLQDFKNIIAKRDESILSYLSENQPKTSRDLVDKKIIYKKHSQFKDYELIAERIMIEKHIEKLLRERLIQEKDSGFILT